MFSIFGPLETYFGLASQTCRGHILPSKIRFTILNKEKCGIDGYNKYFVIPLLHQQPVNILQ